MDSKRIFNFTINLQTNLEFSMNKKIIFKALKRIFYPPLPQGQLPG